MAIELKEINNGKLIEVTLTNELVKEDYEILVPLVDRMIQKHGKIRMLLVMHNFHGWTAGAAWEDTKFTLHHFNDIERLAMVGETKWQHGMAVFSKPFTTATVRYFDYSALAEARAWLEEVEPIKEA
ncbi:MAG TPA: STAS/SEC14 domain-containing protein [Verrucomicrobiae bacterium]|jgi:hypothetical protein|nr:STAS/SEC14 domain-containing protein [Verrucomicrobiae bacterium]